jgi:uncharacterized membrane protein
MQPTVAAKVYEKNAWVLVTIIGAVGVILSLLMIAGIPVDPSFSYANSFERYLSQGTGINLLGYGITGIAISMTAYKKGERWAWYVLWYLPIYFMIDTVLTYQQGGSSWAVGIVLLLISLVALLLPYRIFFPKK